MADDTVRHDGSEGTETAGREAPMRARAWIVASKFCEPADYGVPELPTWAVSRPDGGGVAFAETEGDVPFIRADSPARVRR
ncbi:hypothetical protein [Haloplanus halophilus]|uniref:hypothetical protein n=1 Tax=Haloplanus halophilus TaxID=2949993 RepID=UPI00203CD981|nr:hypothetical protein [Haloplanus sp. GDY1]